MLTYEQLTAIITDRRFTELIGQAETNLLEAKSSLYQLGQDKGKSELAKDVSALANHEGGYLIIGLRTAEDPTSRADKIKEIRHFKQQLLDETQYRQVLDQWVYPPIDNLKVEWVAIEEGSNQGLGVITIPPQPGEKKPFLIAKTVLGSGRRRDILVGYAQRKHDYVEALAVEHIQQLMRDGMSYESLISKRFDELEARLSTITEGTFARHHSSRIESAHVTERINRQATDAGLTDKHYIALAAHADINLELQTLFTSHEGHLGRLIEDPPKLRSRGFGIQASDTSQIIEGTFRRSLYISDMFDSINLALYRDGVLTFIAGATHFCWGMKEYELNALALVEIVYNFCVFFQHVLNDATDTPCVITLHASIIQTPETQRFSLVAGPLQHFSISRANEIKVPCTDLSISIPATEFDPGVAALQLLEEIYIRFSLERDTVPYVEEADGARRVSSTSILTTA